MKSRLFLSFFGISWFAAALVTFVLQLLLFVTVKPLNATLFRRINYYLHYSLWSQLLAVAEHCSKCKVRIFFKDEQTLDHFGKEHSIAVVNHSCNIDWTYVALVLDKFNIAGGLRSFSKSSVKYFPIIGWQLYLNEYGFLHREWKKDREVLAQSMDTFAQNPHPLTVLLFCEGTRFTPEKYAASVDFAKERGIDHFKYHLVPRAKGFIYCVSHAKQDTNKRFPAIYNVQIAFSCSSKRNEPTFNSLTDGSGITGDVYLERISVDSIASDCHDEKALGMYLTDLYHHKDELMDYHKTHQEFPGIKKIIKPRLAPLINLICWFCMVHFFFAYLIVSSIIHGNIHTLTCVLTLLASISLSFFVALKKTETTSQYGGKKVN